MAPVTIAAGCEATLTLIDPAACFVLAEDFLESKAKNTPFLGRTLPGRAVGAYVEGRAILDGGEVVAR